MIAGFRLMKGVEILERKELLVWQRGEEEQKGT